MLKGAMLTKRPCGQALGRSQRPAWRPISSRRSIVPQCSRDHAPVRISIEYKVREGEVLKAVGNSSVLGSWNPDEAPELVPHDGNMWALELNVPVGESIEFKLVRQGQDALWEDGKNRKFAAWGPDYSLDLSCEWGRGSKTVITSQPLKDGAPAYVPLDALAAAAAAERSQGSRVKATSLLPKTDGSNGSTRSSTETWSDEDAPSTQWEGKAVTFMRSNDHSRERGGVWNTHGLEGAEAELVKGDEGAASWLAKLGVLKRLLVDNAPRQRPGPDALAPAYAYLQWVATGAIPCAEGGGHYRPNHHAEQARSIFRSLEWVIGEDVTPQRTAALIARRCTSKLPSFGEAFTQSVPLTRIRDIAHRSDIPHDLKQEIKHTLQNKLHRNAGPEDLVATEEMLRRVTAQPGQYSAAFVEEFKVFTAELRDFFNAGSFSTMLEALRPVLAAEPADAQMLDHFLAAKAKLDGAGQGATLQQIMDVLHALTSIRAMLLAGLVTGLRNDAPDSALAMRQRWRVAEVRAEDYAFVLLSRFVNALEAQVGHAPLARSGDPAWGLPLGALVLGLRQVGLGGWRQAELAALEAEVTAWHKAGGLVERENALRLKASLERAQRACADYTEQLLDTFPSVATRLGAALGIPERMASVFAEAEVRSSLVFQISRLTALLQRSARDAAGAGPWDSLVAGTAVGRLTEVARIDPAALAGVTEPRVLLVRTADGDEEVAAAGRCVRGIVLTQELPHLSHLGVRARQERVPFATLDDAAVLQSQVKPLLGKMVCLGVTPSGVTLREASAAEAQAATAAAPSSSGADAAAPPPVPVPVSLAASPRLMDLPDCTPAQSGAKASACARLEQVARTSRGAAAFKTPRGACLPFGTMQLALEAEGPDAQAAFRAALQSAQDAPLGEGPEGAALEAACTQLQELIGRLTLPGGLAGDVARALGGAAAVMARSSANVEDLAGMSGAGLYDSIANVDPSQPAAVSAAVAAVWASLYSRRAVLSRRAARVAQGDAAMAVLLQEMLAPSASFVLHTASPLGDAPGTAVVEVAAGLGETLASGMRGSPWRLAIDKAHGTVTTLAFANFSQQLLPTSQAAGERGAAPGGGGGGVRYVPAATSGSLGATALAERPAAEAPTSADAFACKEVVVDYGRQALSQNSAAREALGQRIGAIAALLEAEFGGPQDVEGCMVGDDIYIVQTRPQPL